MEFRSPIIARPALGPEIEADDVDSLTIYTPGIPAEFGRKMGGVVEVNALKNAPEGLHGQVNLFGGSFETAGAFAQANTHGRATPWVAAHPET